MAGMEPIASTGATTSAAGTTQRHHLESTAATVMPISSGSAVKPLIVSGSTCAGPAALVKR
ncbi:hypothetical protein ACVWW9_001250 [Agrococcus sp. UYP33]